MRLIALGSHHLTEGLALLGFETTPGADSAAVGRWLEGLCKGGEAAMVLLEDHLARAGGLWLDRVRMRESRIVVVEIPPLSAPRDYHPAVEDLVRRVLGASALEGPK